MWSKLCTFLAGVATTVAAVSRYLAPFHHSELWIFGSSGLAILAAVGVFVFSLREDRTRKREQAERDEKSAELRLQVSKLLEFSKVQQQATALPSEAEHTIRELSLHDDDPRVYVGLARTEKHLSTAQNKSAWIAPTSILKLHNEGGKEARRVQVESLVLHDGRANFSPIECIPAKGNAHVVPETTERFERNDLVRILMRDWEARETGAASELSWPMRITYQDFRGRTFETSFALVLLPIKEMLFHNYGSRPEGQETLFIRNVEIRPLSGPLI